MKHKLLIFSAFLFAACGEPEVACKDDVSFIVKNICIYTNGLDVKARDVNKSLDIIHWNWYEKFGYDETEILDLYIDEDGYNQASISFHPKLCNKHNEKECYAGLTRRTSVNLLYATYQQECFANTAIGHEFLHVLGYLYEMKYGHSNGELFLNEKNVTNDCYFFGIGCEQAKETLENKINVEMCNYFCPDSCWWWRAK